MSDAQSVVRGVAGAGKIVLLLAVVTSCASCIWPAREEPVYLTAERAELVGMINANARAVRGFVADVDVDARLPDESYRADGLIAVEHPDRLRLTLEAAFRTRLDMCSDGEQLFIYVPDMNVVRHGYLAELERGYPKWPLRPRDLVQAFAMAPIGEDEPFALEKWRDHYTLVFYSQEPMEGGVLRKVVVDRRDLRISEVLYFDVDGFPLLGVSLKDYIDLGEGQIPSRVHLVWFEQFEKDVVLDLKVSDPTLGVPPAVFVFDELPGVPVEPIVPPLQP